MTSTRLQRNTFITKLQENNLPEGTIIVEEEVKIDTSNLTWEFKKIENVSFESKVLITSANIKSGFAFFNCNFNKGIEFNDISSTFNKSQGHSVQLLFNKCKGKDILVDECLDLADYSISINSESNFKKVVCSNSNLENIDIENSNIELVSLHCIFNNSSIKIRNNTIDRIIFDDLDSTYISFEENSINKNVDLNQIRAYVAADNYTSLDNLMHGLFLRLNTFNGSFRVLASDLGGLSIFKDVFNNKFELQNGGASLYEDNPISSEFQCRLLSIIQARFILGAELNGFKNVVNQLQLEFSASSEGFFNLYDWSIIDLKILGSINRNTTLLFKNINFKSLSFVDLTNYSDMSFVNCTTENGGVMTLENIDFGSARFNGFDFRAFSKIKLDNVTFDKIRSSNVKWYDNNQLEIGSKITKEDSYRVIRELSQQLKYALAGAGNNIDSLIFKAREMQAYRNELKANPKNYSWKDRFIMTVNLSNNFGLSWWKPTWIIFLVTIGFYIIVLPLFSTNICYCIPSSVDDVLNTLNAFWNNLDAFWQLFNPARRFLLVYGSVESGLLQFLDLLHRIVLGIFIYQIIRGFRRFSLK